MNYDQLFSFVAFAEHLNFTRAAGQLHISQPALHVQIAKLAESVGFPLYRRKGRALSLTVEGARLAAFGREVKERGQCVLDELHGAAHSGPVVLAAGEGSFLYLLGSAIRRFSKQRWPLRLLPMRGPETIEAVRDSRAHLGVIAADVPPPDLEALALRSIGQVVILPASHRLSQRQRVVPRDLSGEQIVVAPVGNPHRTMLAQALSAARVDWKVAVEATGWELVLHFARCGVGIAVVNDFCTVPRGMVAVPLEGVARVTYFLLRRTGLRNQQADALHRLIIETTAGPG
ncbi:MAG: LysR family transcriptional regulator [Deltaproteobacteria bacterium]|nr:LysR family transcriptional regulator [Deltaproteobacteria bacterium]